MNPPAILVALDSFKECASSKDVNEWVAQGLRLSLPNEFVVETIEVCDGGAGFMEVLAKAGKNVDVRHLSGCDSMLSLVEDIKYALVDSEGGKRVAVLESADTIGLGRISKSKRTTSVLDRSSFGLGKVLKAAAEQSPDEILVGMGDSAVQDCGTGLLAALGAEFSLADGKKITGPAVTPRTLLAIRTIDISNLVPIPPIRIVCNLSSVLSGSAATVDKYAKQKGATNEEVKALRIWTQRVTEIYNSLAGFDVGRCPGSGSSGGVGSALIAAYKAVPEYSFRTLDLWTGIKGRIEAADVVIVGEGQLDSGTVRGKVPGALALMASGFGIPVVAVAGSVAPDVFGSLTAAGVTTIQTLSTPSQRKVDYMERGKARRLLRGAGVRIAPIVELLSQNRTQPSITPQGASTWASHCENYDLAIIDLWQTLITRNWKHNFVEAVARALASVGLDVNHRLVQECLGVSMLRRRQDREVFAARILDFTSDERPPSEIQRNAVLEVLRSMATEQGDHAQWIQGGPRFLEVLRKSGARLVAVSNSTSEVDQVLSRLGVRDYFDEVLLSCDVGFAKPNLRLYLSSELIHRAHVERRRVVVIGDQFDKDILPAQLLGFDSILVKHGVKERPPLWYRTRPAIGSATNFTDLTSLVLGNRKGFDDSEDSNLH